MGTCPVAQRIVIDTNTNCTKHVASLKARGVTHIGRYYARSAHSDKRLLAAEAQALSAAGFQMFVVYEDSGDPQLTVERGKQDGLSAYTQANQVGQPAGTCIYFAMEHLPHGYGPEHVPGLKLYFEGVKQIIHPTYKVGCYGNGLTLTALLDDELIDYAWVSASTSFAGTKDFLKSDKWHLAQRQVDKNWDGVSVDTNDAADDFGCFSLNATPISADALDPAQIAENGKAILTEGGAVAMVEHHDSQPPKRSWSDWDLAHVNELADQGSRLAAKLRGGWTAFKAFLFGSGAVAGGAATFVDPNKGNAAVVHSWGSAHPFLMAILGAGLVFVVLGGIIVYFGRGAIRGLVTAKKDNRYKPRGAA